MFLSDPGVSSIAEAVRAHRAGSSTGFLILLGETDAPDLQGLTSALSALDVPFVGGVFPALLEGADVHPSGAVVVPLPFCGPPVLVKGLDRHRPPGLLLDSVAAEIPPPGCGTALILVDGLAAAIQPLLSGLFSRFGGLLKFFGGGAGSASFEPMPCLFCNEGVFQDAALVAFVGRRCSLGVRHGWTPIVDPVVVTRARGPVVEELNWRPAFEVYREAVRRDSGVEIDPASFFQHAKRFPLGMQREGTEGVVRDPVTVTPEGGLRCVGEVPENAVLRVLKGDPDRLVDAAALAAGEAASGLPGDAREALVADCVSRALYHGDGFSREVRSVQERIGAARPGLTAEGMLTVGEVATFSDGSLVLLNKTVVVGLLHD